MADDRQSTSQTANRDSGFAGWHRKNKHHPWRRVTEAESEAQCWNQLLTQALPSGEKCVVGSTVDPNHPPAPVARGARNLER
jgi:hypothetical protein